MDIAQLVRRDKPRTDGAKGIAAFAFVPLTTALELVGPLRQVVDQHVARHVVQRIGLTHIAGLGANDHPQLHLPVGFDRAEWNLHRVIGA